ncbi:hypothetical protein I4U23_010989 [Adineta vaga]|nr:hypothetical protein I4U23_010980 [Adineta vaga]UJR06703.1 hypothetical protein I4U23_010989 [Adineta vaga]
MATCQSSVQSSTNPPPRMPPLISSYSQPISCIDDYSYIIYGFYQFNLYTAFLYNISYSLFSAYFSSNTVMCMVSYTTRTNFTWRSPLTMEEYDAAVNPYGNMYAIDHTYRSRYWQIAYGPGNFIASYVDNQISESFCYCTTSNCNIDLATCTSRLY